MPDISDLLKDAANIFAQLAAEYENDRKHTQDQLAHLETKTAENREALRAAAESIISKLS
jgi:hypothetical protein